MSFLNDIASTAFTLVFIHRCMHGAILLIPREEPPTQLTDRNRCGVRAVLTPLVLQHVGEWWEE